MVDLEELEAEVQRTFRGGKNAHYRERQISHGHGGSAEGTEAEGERFVFVLKYDDCSSDTESAGAMNISRPIRDRNNSRCTLGPFPPSPLVQACCSQSWTSERMLKDPHERNPRNASEDGRNPRATFKIPTVNHSYRVDGVMCMITPCLLAAINFLSGPTSVLGSYRYPESPTASEDFEIAVTQGLRRVMVRQGKQMTSNNPDILFTRLFSPPAWKGGIPRATIFRAIEAR
ncbi:hypothetical protein KM043_009879 [Ampulex compressa]|nr:hypothetical protein KM043_009879 [Ampulex compressa]